MRRRVSVSVVIPTFNRAGFLEEAIQSVLRQTCLPEQVVVADDASTDDTAQRMERLTQEIQAVAVVYVRLPRNSGGDAARRAGLARCSGTYVAFLDSDDEWLPDHLERCVAGLKANPQAVLVFSDYGLMDARRRPLIARVREPKLSHPPIPSLLFKRIIVQYSRTLYVRQAVLAVGGVPYSIMTDDWVLNMRLLGRWPNGIVHVPGATAVFRLHGSQSASHPGTTVNSLLNATEQVMAALPVSWRGARRRVLAINLIHSANFFWRAGYPAAAWRYLIEAGWTDPGCLFLGDWWSAQARLLIPPQLGGLLRSCKRPLQRFMHPQGKSAVEANGSAAAVLYLSYDGLLDPLGRSQVLPYLKGLANRQNKITLITFEKAAAWNNRSEREAISAEVAGAGIHWVPLRYHKWPPVLSTFYDMTRMGWVGAWKIRRQGVKIIHCRSYVPAAVGATLARISGARLLFDMREFWVDGRVEHGLWKRDGLLHRLGSRCERRLFRSADWIVTLTHRSAKTLKEHPILQKRGVPVSVIPTCVDIRRFLPNAKQEAKGVFTVAFVGSVGTWYLHAPMIAWFRQFCQSVPRAHFLWLVSNGSEVIEEALKEAGIAQHQYTILSVPHHEVPRHLAGATACIFFRRPGFATSSSTPTKTAESLACGAPIVVNRGVGDLDQLIEECRVGILVEAFSPAAYALSIVQLLDLLKEGAALRMRCRQAAEKAFSLDDGIDKYEHIYAQLAQN